MIAKSSPRMALRAVLCLGACALLAASPACNRERPNGQSGAGGAEPRGGAGAESARDPYAPAFEDPAHIANDPPQMTAGHVEAGAITVDGNLDEAEWLQAGSTGPLVNPGGGELMPNSPVQGHARVLWSDTHLYVAFVVHDPDPAAPFERDAVDPHLWERSSGIELMLQPGDPGDNTHYYEVQVDTAGAVWDTRFDDYNRPIADTPSGRTFGHQDWDAQLERAARVDSGRYIIEMALPWAALESARTAIPPAAGDTWRANFYSFRDGQGHSLAWSPLRGEGNFHRSSRFGFVRF